MESQAIIDSDLKTLVTSLSWYHTIDLGNGIITPGIYDHRPYLKYYGLPADLTGKTALDIGAASGFFSFELERRGARVTATDLPAWFDHDFGPSYQPDQTLESGDIYLHQPLLVAKRALNSKVEIKYLNIYDIGPEKLGIFDLVFCGSVLLHLTDPIKAFWNIAQVTKEKAIIATAIAPDDAETARADFVGYQRGDVWWIPTRKCLELWAVTAGFAGVEWISEFPLNSRDRSDGPYHGVIHCYKTPENWTPHTKSRDDIIASLAERQKQDRHAEIEELKTVIARYQQRRSVRFANWFHDQRNKVTSRLPRNR